jgi:hypothetical protein
MANSERKGYFRAFLDFFILFGGVSTASGLARTQGRRPRTGGVFLFRRPPFRSPDAPAAVPATDDAPRS